MARFTLPTLDDLKELGAPRENAITIYAETSPAPDARETSYLNAKSAFDQASEPCGKPGFAMPSRSRCARSGRRFVPTRCGGVCRDRSRSS